MTATVLAFKRPDAAPVAPVSEALDPVALVFDAGGLLAREGRELRAGQRALAAAVRDVVADGAVEGHAGLLAEAPCGTGKSLAYLVPAIHHAATRGKTVVVATANIALQEQLVTKDLPYLQKLLPWSFEFALQKGMGNYLCRWQRDNCDGYPASDAEVQQLRAIDVWAESTTTGDKAELPFVPVDNVWRLRSIDRDDCLGKACPHIESCFARQAKAKAQAADVIVVNQHLLFAHISMKMEFGADVVLPRWDVLIVDEAHEAADIAREFFGATLRRSGVARAAKWLRTLMTGETRMSPSAIARAKLAEDLTVAWDVMWAAVDAHFTHHAPRGEDLLVVKAPWLDADAVVALLSRVASTAQMAARGEGGTDEEKVERQKASNVARRMGKLHGWLSLIAAASDPGYVTWLKREERHGRGGAGQSSVQLEARPLDVAPLLREYVWGYKTTIATSATLTTGKGVSGWDFARRQLGADTAKAVAVPSPFDFRRQAVLCIPRGNPHPSEARDAFDARLGEHLRALIAAANGRTLGLFTSLRVVDAMRAAVRDCGHTVLAQGDRPRTDLVEAFKADPSSVLLGTRSMWTGVDVQGEACVAVLIDRVPFPQKSEPVIAALCERANLLSGDGAAGFRDEFLPRAVLALRQGVGRLIRSQSDWGAVVICDGRLLSASWGRRVIEALGLPVQVDGMDGVARWFAQRAGDR